MRKTFFLLSFLILAGCSFLNPSSTAKLVFETGKAKTEYRLEVAHSKDERANGLMFRTSLPEKQGMLFVFDKPARQSFWMRNTLIPLDIVFMDGDYKIVDIKKGFQPCKTVTCEVYTSSVKALYALEINAGEADKFGIETGGKAQLLK